MFNVISHHQYKPKRLMIDDDKVTKEEPYNQEIVVSTRRAEVKFKSKLCEEFTKIGLHFSPFTEKKWDEKLSGMFSERLVVNSYSIDQNVKKLDILYNPTQYSSMDYDYLISWMDKFTLPNTQRISFFCKVMKKAFENKSDPDFNGNYDKIFEPRIEQAFYQFKTFSYSKRACRSTIYLLNQNILVLLKSESNYKFWNAAGMTDFDWLDSAVVNKIHKMSTRYSKIPFDSMIKIDESEYQNEPFLILKGKTTIYDADGAAISYFSSYYACLYQSGEHKYLEFLLTHEKDENQEILVLKEKKMVVGEVFPKEKIKICGERSLMKYYQPGVKK